MVAQRWKMVELFCRGGSVAVAGDIGGGGCHGDGRRGEKLKLGFHE